MKRQNAQLRRHLDYLTLRGGLWVRLLALLVGLLELACSPATRRVGDGQLFDKGFGTYYPRFTVEMPLVPLDGSSLEHEFNLEHLPRVPYSVRLLPRVGTTTVLDLALWENTWRELESASVSVKVSFRSADPGEAVGPQFAGKLAGAWDPAARGDQWYFCTASLERLRLAPNTTVRLRATVANPEVLSTPASVQLILVGGGLEK